MARVIFLGALLIWCCCTLSFTKHQPTSQQSSAEFSKVSDGVNDNNNRIAAAMFKKFANGSQRRNVVYYLRELSRWFPVSVDYTLTVARQCDVVKNNKQFYYLTPLFVAIQFILIGFLLGFFGYRLIRVVLFLLGFSLGFYLTFYIAEVFQTRESWLSYVALAAAVLIGAATGFLLLCIYPLGIFLAGASIGFLLVWFIAGGINAPFLRDHLYVPFAVAILLAGIIGIMALVLQKWFFIAGTSTMGAFLAAWGLDYFVELGFMVYYLLLFADDRSELNPCWYSWLIMMLFFLLVLVGFAIQSLVTGRKFEHKDEIPGLCWGWCKRRRNSKGYGSENLRLIQADRED